MERVLDCFEKDDWYQGKDYLVFGPGALALGTLGKLPESSGGILRDEGLSGADLEARDILGEILKTIGLKEGDRLSTQRTSMDGTADAKPLFEIAKYSGEGIAAFRNLMEAIYQSREQFEAFVEEHQSELEQVDPDSDAMGARYAREVVGKIAKIVSRVSVLDPFETGKVASKSVRDYFIEVHHCYLYGFRVACAVMCRAILEQALKEVVDHNGAIEQQIAKESWARGKRVSYITALAQRAVKMGILADDRPSWVERIKKVGDWAVHNLDKFRQEFPDNKFDEVLLNTRKILIDLYAPREAGTNAP